MNLYMRLFKEYSIKHITEMSSVLCVTAFRDINRGSWSGRHAQWVRSVDEYISWFSNLAKLPVDLVCFCDEPVASKICNQTKFSNIFPYDEQDTFFKYIEKERDVMNNNNYKSLLSHRINHPEHSIPEYNIVQHNKTSFVRRASNMFPTYTHYAWIDFGYIRDQNSIPNTIDWSPVATERIHYATFQHINDPSHIQDPLVNCIHAPSIVQGSMFILPRTLATWYESAYTTILTEQFYKKELTDDDQAIVLQVYKNHFDMFDMHVVPEWFGFFKYVCNNPTMNLQYK